MTLKDLDIDIIEPTTEEIKILNQLGEDYKAFSEMSEQDRAFINSLILRNKPLKVLEIGVYRGASSLVILNALKHIPNSKLYSCDYNELCYKDKDKKTGYIVDQYNELKKNWSLHTGGYTCNFLDEIGKEIDFCLIDTAHVNPGEILDFLMVLPYLKNNAIVVLHDTNLHARITDNENIKAQYTTNLLTSSIYGRKILPSSEPYESDFPFINISAIKLTDETKKHIFEVFNLLTIKWEYLPNKKDLSDLLAFLPKHYNEYHIDYLTKVIQYQSANFELKRQYKKSKKKSFIKNIFAAENIINDSGKHKQITFFGIKFKFKKGT